MAVTIKQYGKPTHAWNIPLTSPSTAKGHLPRLQGEVWFNESLLYGVLIFALKRRLYPLAVNTTNCTLNPKGIEDWIAGKTMHSLHHIEIPFQNFTFLQYNFKKYNFIKDASGLGTSGRTSKSKRQMTTAPIKN